MVGSINCCYCYLLDIGDAVIASSGILGTIYPIGCKVECDGKVDRNWVGTKGPVGVDMGECEWSEEYNSDAVKHAGKKIV